MKTYAQQKRADGIANDVAAGAIYSSIPNSALASRYGMDDDSTFNEELQSRFERNQIPSAENEADAIASGITANTMEGVKQELGQKMDADFSNVRMHTDGQAAQTADSMGAIAYTQGSDVYFGSAGFDPAIAAHELVHTAQQGSVDSGMAVEAAPAGGVQMASWKGFKKGVGNFFSGIKRRLFGGGDGGQAAETDEQRAARLAQQTAAVNAQNQAQAAQFRPLIDPRIGETDFVEDVVKRNSLSQPTAGLGEQQSILDHEIRSRVAGHRRAEEVQGVSQAFFGGSTSEVAGEWGRRVEALYNEQDPTGFQNEAIFNTMREINASSSRVGPTGKRTKSDVNADQRLNSPEFQAQISTALSPVITELGGITGDANALKQRALGDYAGTKAQLGKFHAIADIMERLPDSYKQSLFSQLDQQNGDGTVTPGYDVFSAHNKRVNAAYGAGHRELTKKFGLSGSFNNVLDAIKPAIGREAAQTPLSDFQIVKQLSSTGGFDPTSSSFTGGMSQMQRVRNKRAAGQRYQARRDAQGDIFA